VGSVLIRSSIPPHSRSRYLTQTRYIIPWHLIPRYISDIDIPRLTEELFCRHDVIASRGKFAATSWSNGCSAKETVATVVLIRRYKLLTTVQLPLLNDTTRLSFSLNISTLLNFCVSSSSDWYQLVKLVVSSIRMIRPTDTQFTRYRAVFKGGLRVQTPPPEMSGKIFCCTKFATS